MDDELNTVKYDKISATGIVFNYTEESWSEEAFKD
jgi:hypothetical protein